MAQFLGDIAFLLEMALVALGLVLLHRAAKERAGLLRLAGVVLVATGILGALCTGYFWFRYYGQGGFDHAHPPMMDAIGEMPMHMPEGGMPGGMRGGPTPDQGAHEHSP